MSEEKQINRKCPNSYSRTYYSYWIKKKIQAVKTVKIRKMETVGTLLKKTKTSLCVWTNPAFFSNLSPIFQPDKEPLPTLLFFKVPALLLLKKAEM